MSGRWKWILVGAINLLLMGAIGCAFWLQDWQYALPTPRPHALAQPALGSRPESLDLKGQVLSREKPLFLHFFSPECPCSRFNLEHIRQLRRRFDAAVRFVTVVEQEPTRERHRALADCRLDMETVFDPDGRIARTYGVYSTPQAVLLDVEGRLVYRGNFNTGRYCSRAATEFARLALEALLAGRAMPAFPRAATIAYGCALPSNASHP